ncbi:MAG TPA: hypothetical protein VEX66_17880 [Microlunatus sp.]|nr:hypothetical protein [Microlunatus sp.]
MADTLASLAGAQWLERDVISAFSPTIPAENAELDHYVFLPYARSGVAAALAEPFDWTKPARGRVTMAVPVIDDRGAKPAEMVVNVYGPGDVTELDTRQVIRTWPRADAADTEIDDLVQVEFDRPELPWLFTPCAPVADRLVPWLTLVLAEAGTLTWGPVRGSTRAASIRRDQLQSLDDAWAWAHAQVMGRKDTADSLGQRLSGVNAPFNLSRLLCPRRLAPDTAYTACVVPTFLAGAQAGLGLTPVDVLTRAWSNEDPEAEIALPVYYAWSFSTGEAGNFESLARKIISQPAPAGVGRRRVDATRPWPDAGLTADDPGAEMVVLGPIVSLADPGLDQSETWPTEEQQTWAPAVTDQLIERLNRADAQEHQPSAEAEDVPPLVTPPLYGGTHRQQPRIQVPPEPVDQPEWFRQLNLDPRHRIVGGLGTRVVQAEQEALMASAWNQVIGIEAANRALRLAQLAKRVGAVLHRRHLDRLSESAVVSATERVHGKLLAEPEVTVWSTLAASTLPPAVTTGAFRRLLRSRGPVVKAAGTDVAATARIEAVEALAVRPEDSLTTDWVLRYTPPDGVGRLTASARDRISVDIAAQVAPDVDRDTMLQQWSDGMRRPGPEAMLGPEALGRAQFGSVDLAERVLPTTLTQLLASLPDRRQMAEDPDEAASGAALAAQIFVLAELAMRRQIRTISVPLRDVRRLDLPVEDRDGRQSALVPTEPLFGWARQLLDDARQFFPDISLPDVEAQAGRLADQIAGTIAIEGPELARGFSRLAEKLVLDDVFAEPDRPRVDAPGLQLKAKLDPLILVPARIDARLTGGTGRIPSWLRPTWFADRRVEPVMAHPRFEHPMYEPLDRYERDWMIPGLGKIKRPDMSTLLQTNNTFVEAYLVGLNHEMGRELLWREYPTDQRGTYFHSFWTRQPELAADLHEPAWSAGELRSHLTLPDGRLVLLVRGDLIRRYPGVLAHAVRQAQEGGELQTDAGVPLFETAGPNQPVRTLFRIVLPPNILLVGFDLERTQIENGPFEWWFTLSENPTEPRFGLDVPPDPPVAGPRGREDLQWNDFGVGFDEFLQGGVGAVVFSGDLNEEIRWGTTSAQIASLLFQLPARAAYNGKRMIEAVG